LRCGLCGLSRSFGFGAFAGRPTRCGKRWCLRRLRPIAASPASSAAITVAPKLLLLGVFSSACFSYRLSLLHLRLVRLGFELRLPVFCRLGAGWFRKSRLQRCGSVLTRLVALLLALLFAPLVAVA
jgi:hypothetical protein